MHTAWMRVNALGFFALSCLVVISFALNLSTLLQTQEPITLETLQVDQIHRFVPIRQQDRVLFSFDVNYDLRPAFTWNVKHMFVAIVAEFQTKGQPFNQVVIHDRIIRTSNQAFLNPSKVNFEYELEDVGMDLRGTEVQFSLMWDVMPYVGFIHTNWERTIDNKIVLPSSYIQG